MALSWTGREVRTETGENRLGEDGEGNRVMVCGTYEATNDYGWPTVWRVAESKYARGDYQDGDTRQVRVTTTDCIGEDDGTT